MTTNPSAADYEIEVFYDGGCPVCSREIRMLQRRDLRRQMRFVDIDAPEFDAVSVGKTRDELMARIHGRLPDGTWVTGVEVFRHIYTLIGLGALVAVTRLPLISHLLDGAYAVFARYRPRLRRCTAETCAGRWRANHTTVP